jgi:hypothetical protein
MSADNWALCPACLARTRRETIHETDIESLRTFREDYELGVQEDGTFYVRYRGGCTKCDFGHRFIHEVQAYADVPADEGRRT